jgi:hypothetical protein
MDNNHKNRNLQEKDISIDTGDVSDAIRKPLPSVVILVTPGST